MVVKEEFKTTQLKLVKQQEQVQNKCHEKYNMELEIQGGTNSHAILQAKVR